MKFTSTFFLRILILIPLFYIIATVGFVNARVYDLGILYIDFKESPRYKNLSYEKHDYKDFTVYHYHTATAKISQSPFEIFSLTITTFKQLPSKFNIKDALSQSAYGYLKSQGQGSNSDRSRFTKLQGKDALEVEYNELTLGTRNIATFLLHGKSLVTLEYRTPGRQITDYSPYRNFVRTLFLK